MLLMKVDQFLSLLKKVKQKDHNQWQACCPAHDDQVASLSVGVNGKNILVHCHAGCSTKSVVRAMGLQMVDLFIDKPQAVNKSQKKEPKPISEAEMLKGSHGHWDYEDKNGTLLYRIVRYPNGDSKRFLAHRLTQDGHWLRSIEGVRRVLYRLPQLLAADPKGAVFIPEGEKHVDRLISLDLIATCNPFGAGSWRDEYSAHLKGRRVVILADNDKPGRDHARGIADSLQGVAASVEILELEDLPEHGDVSDWLDTGHAADELISLAETLPKAPRLVADQNEKTIEKASCVTLDECLGVIKRWLLLPEDVVVRYLLALVVANRLPGDPVWGFIIAPSGGAKTELLNSLSRIPSIYPLSDLTPQTFISGYKENKRASLLTKLEPGTILTLKDFTTVLSMHRDSRQAILSQLREIADGSYRKEFGTGKRVVWEGKLGFIAGCTPILDHHQAVYALLGERFLQMRPPLPARKALAKAARTGTGKEKQMRHELQEAMAGCISGVKLEDIPTWPENLGEALDSLATLCALARSGTVRDSYHKELQLIPEPEVPTRLVKQLFQLGQALGMLRGASQVELEDYAIVGRVAIDTIPHTRWRILSCLLEQGEQVKTANVAAAVGLPTSTTRRHLDDLAGLTLVVGDKGGSGVAAKWGVSVECSDLVAKSLTLPQKSPHGGERKIIREDTTDMYTHPTSVERFRNVNSEQELQPYHAFNETHEEELVGIPV